MKIALTVFALIAALPAVAQMPPPPPGETMPGPDGAGRAPMRGPMGGHMGGPMGGMRGMQRMFGSMSEAGRATMTTAMRGTDPRAGHMATKAARDRMLAVLDGDRLDPVALKRAMDDEREAATAAKVRRQAAMLGAFQQLSLADRRAFVADARAMRMRMDGRMAAWNARRGGPGEMMLPPPPPQ